ncbi:hypothetical protein AX769_03880 [Frondihabitans sp. PAMC 28766]|uniref:AI-2E family transporter n=1 Tax=Frondihabitans sp. PAMC 28766 TaxID=1795630 RepID=UPI00078DF2D0|nr:AI-2E family transporter [Frondihabitans sp. PAMC 28766]AMM19438.1 hypothetical protein AX769_03880 [Frondihabitans sp. PAMC 28766]
MGTGVVSGISGIVIVLILTVYFSVALPRLTERAFQFVPASRATGARSVYDDMTHSVGRYVAGQVLIAAVNATLTSILLLIFHIPGAVLLTAIAFLGGLIPVAGTIVEAIIVISVALFTSPVAFIAAIAFFVIYHPLEAYVIHPRVMARVVHVSGTLIVLSVLGGAALGGVLGALIAVPVVAASTIFADRVVIPRQKAR